MEIPNRLEALTAAWLTDALRQGGALGSARVTDFEIQPVGAATAGITGEMARLQLRYDDPATTAPTTLIAKLHSPNEQARAMANSIGMYRMEFRFYRDIVRHTQLPAPRCYYGDFQEPGFTVLLLEDLAPARSLGWDLNEAQVELAVREIARFHAVWWENSQLDELLGAEDPAFLQGVAGMLQQTVRDKWAGFVELAGDRLPPAMRSIGQRIVDQWAFILYRLRAEAPRTLMHADFHGDNLLFGMPEGGRPLAVIDWQLAGRGKGAYDVGMLLGTISTAQRRACEADLLKLYHQTLLENGVTGYSLEHCRDDYRLAQLDCFARLVYTVRGPLPGEDLAWYQGFANKFLDVELPKRCAAILELEAGQLLSA